MDDTQITQLRNVKKMLDEGILTQEEFDKIKMAILEVSENESLMPSPSLAIVADKMPGPSAHEPSVIVATPEAALAPTMVQPGVSSVNNLSNDNKVHVAVNMGGKDTTVAHGCHFACCILTGGLWLPCWCFACCGCCCERPCGC